MWHDLSVEQIPLAEKVIRTIGVYALLMVLFRLTGKRGLAAMNTFDFIVIFLLSNVVQNAVIGNDNSLLGGMVGAVTLVAVNAGVNRLTTISPIAASTASPWRDTPKCKWAWQTQPAWRSAPGEGAVRHGRPAADTSRFRAPPGSCRESSTTVTGQVPHADPARGPRCLVRLRDPRSGGSCPRPG